MKGLLLFLFFLAGCVTLNAPKIASLPKPPTATYRGNATFYWDSLGHMLQGSQLIHVGDEFSNGCTHIDSAITIDRYKDNYFIAHDFTDTIYAVLQADSSWKAYFLYAPIIQISRNSDGLIVRIDRDVPAPMYFDSVVITDHQLRFVCKNVPHIPFLYCKLNEYSPLKDDDQIKGVWEARK